jgi:hypothetical protein
MKKKIGITSLIMMIFFVSMMFSGIAFAASSVGGILDGKSVTYGLNGVGNSTNAVTDGSDTTSIVLPPNHSVRYVFPSPVNITHYFYNAAGDQANASFRFQYYNAAGGLITQVQENGFGLYVARNVSSVKEVRLVNVWSTNATIYELNFKGVVPPNAPTGLNATGGSKQVQLTWNAVGAATKYNIYQNGSLIASPTTTSYTATGLTDLTEYSYEVTAENANGESVKSSTVKATPRTFPDPPTVTATAGNQIVTLNWNTVPGVASYKVYQGGVLLGSTTIKPYVVKGLTNGTSYSFQVSSVNANGDSVKSAAATATPTITPPTGFTAVPGNTIVTLDWQDVGGATNYKIYQDGTLLTTTTTKPYVVNNLTNGTVYSYQITAFGGGGESIKSAAATAKPDNPPIPSGLTATARNQAITLDWISVPVATSYKIYSGAALIATVTAAPYEVTGLTNGTAYSFQITALNQMGESDQSAPATATPNNAIAPMSLQASISSKKVVLSWKSVVPAATKYQVYRDGVLISEPTGTSFSDTNLVNGTNYKYEVAAVSSVGTSPKSFVFAKPSENVSDLTGVILPFSVVDMVKTALNYLGMFPSWILTALGIIFCPILLAIVSHLLGFEDKKGKNGKNNKVLLPKDGKQLRDKYEAIKKTDPEKYSILKAAETEKNKRAKEKLTEKFKAEKAAQAKIKRMAPDGRKRRKDGTLTAREREKISKSMHSHVLRTRREGR